MIDVMIVDDQDIICMALKHMLESSGNIRVSSICTNGLNAIETCKEHKPEIILMDISMPVMNGIEATRQIKALYNDIDIIVLTTPNNQENIDKAIEAGAASYIFKNAKSNEFINAVTNVHIKNKISQQVNIYEYE